MGYVIADIILKNFNDILKTKMGFTEKPEIRQTKVKAIVDTGAGTLVINEEIRRELGLELDGEKPVRLANGVREIVKIADPVEITWKNRKMMCQPWYIPGAGEVLLGAIPLEDMDLIVDPGQQELTGRHGEEAIGLLY